MGAVPVRSCSVGRSGRLRRDPPLRALCRCRRWVRWRVTARLAGLLWLSTSVVLTCAAIGAAVVLAPRAGGSPDAVWRGCSSWARRCTWPPRAGSSRIRDSRPCHRAARSLPLGPRRPPGHRGAPCGGVEPAAPWPWVLLPLLAWQLHHFQKQNLGQAALVTASLGLPHCGRTNVGRYARPVPQVSPESAHIRHCSNWTSGCHSRDTWRSGDRLLLAVGVAAGGYALARRPGSDRPATFCAVYGLALLFPLPIFLFTSPYAAVAGMTMAHGLQYLLLMGLLAAGTRRRRRLGAVPPCARLPSWAGWP